MHIKSIGLSRFKGQTAVYATEKLNLLIGPNGSGKSAVVEAVSYAVLGRTQLGGTHEATAQLAGVNGCGVSVALDDGFIFSRELKREPRTGRLSQAVNISGREELGVRQAGPAIAEHVGAFAPMFDLGEFADLSADKQRDQVLQLCADAGGLAGMDMSDPKAIEDLARRIMLAFVRDALGEATVDVAANDPNVLLPQLREGERRHLAGAMADIRGELGAETLPLAIKAAIDKAKDLANLSRARKDEAHAAARKLSARKAELGELSAESIEALKEQIAAREAERTEIVEQLGLQQGKAAALADARKRVDDAAAKIERYTMELDALGQAPNVGRAVELDVEAERVEAIPETSSALDDYRRERRRIQEELTAAGEYWIEASAELNRLSADLDVKRQRLDMLKVSPWARLAEIVAEIDRAGVCIHVNTESMRGWWREIVAIIAKHALPDGIEQSTEAVQAAKKPVEDAITAVANAAKQKDTLELKLCRADADLREAETREHDLAESRRMDAERARKLRLDIDQIRRAAEVYAAENQRLTQAIVAARIERVDAERRLNELEADGGQIDAETLAAQRDGLTETITNLRKRIEDKQARDRIHAELAACTASAEQETVMHDVCKRLGLAIRSLREELMDELISPLLERMNRFLLVAAPDRPAYCRLVNDKGASIFELGWLVEGQRRSYPALSGGEHAIFGCALAYALVALADPPLKLLLAECGEIDAGNMSLLMDGLEAIGSDLSNVLVATHSLVGAASDKWKTIHMEAAPMTAESMEAVM